MERHEWQWLYYLAAVPQGDAVCSGLLTLFVSPAVILQLSVRMQLPDGASTCRLRATCYQSVAKGLRRLRGWSN